MHGVYMFFYTLTNKCFGYITWLSSWFAAFSCEPYSRKRLYGSSHVVSVKTETQNS